VDETRGGVNAKFEIWWTKGFRLSRTKTEDLKCKFSKSRNNGEGVLRLDGQEIAKRENFWNLGSIIHKDGEIKENVNHKIRAWWMK